MNWIKFKDKKPDIYEKIMFIAINNLVPRDGYLDKSVCTIIHQGNGISINDLSAWINLEEFIRECKIREILLN